MYQCLLPNRLLTKKLLPNRLLIKKLLPNRLLIKKLARKSCHHVPSSSLNYSGNKPDFLTPQPRPTPP